MLVIWEHFKAFLGAHSNLNGNEQYDGKNFLNIGKALPNSNYNVRHPFLISG